MTDPAKRAIGAGIEYPDAAATLDRLAPEMGGTRMEVAYLDADIRRTMREAGSEPPENAVFIARDPDDADRVALVLEDGKAEKSY